MWNYGTGNIIFQVCHQAHAVLMFYVLLYSNLANRFIQIDNKVFFLREQVGVSYVAGGGYVPADCKHWGLTGNYPACCTLLSTVAFFEAVAECRRKITALLFCHVLLHLLCEVTMREVGTVGLQLP